MKVALQGSSRIPFTFQGLGFGDLNATFASFSIGPYYEHVMVVLLHALILFF